MTVRFTHPHLPLPLPLFLTLLDRKLGAKSPPATGPWHENHTHNPRMVSPQSQPMKWSRVPKGFSGFQTLHDSNIYAIHQQQQLAEGKYRAGIVYSHPSPLSATPLIPSTPSDPPAPPFNIGSGSHTDSGFGSLRAPPSLTPQQ